MFYWIIYSANNRKIENYLSYLRSMQTGACGGIFAISKSNTNQKIKYYVNKVELRPNAQ